MSDLKEFLHYKALGLKFSLENSDLTDAVIESGNAPIPLRNVCAKLTPELADRLDKTCNHLGISKRQFIERALIEAMNMADQALDECGVWEALERSLERE